MNDDRDDHEHKRVYWEDVTIAVIGACAVAAMFIGWI